MRRFLLLTALMLFAYTCFAQVTTATVTGRVVDKSNAVIPDAKITVTNTGTGIQYEKVTDDTGNYTVPSLPPGRYMIEVEKQGFKAIVESNVNLHVQEVAAFNFEMSVGSVTEHVTVEAAAATLETATSTLSALVNQNQMRDLPLNGRDYQQLILLAPGVQPVNQQTSNNNYGRGLSFSSGGIRPEGQAMLLDGTDIQNMTGHGAGGGILGTSLGVDAISEFSVLTSTYSAEFGGNGLVVNASTRSGTNIFHGSAFDFLRNSVFDARTYFEPLSGPPPFRRNQFGGTFGGPIKKDKAFFFVDYEGVRQALAETAVGFVPNANAQKGYLPCAGAPTYTCDSETGLAYVGVNSAIAPLMAIYPSPSGPDQGNGTAKLTTVGNNPVNENYLVARTDQTLSAKDNLFGRVVVDGGTFTDPFPGQPQGTDMPFWPETDLSHNLYATIEEKRLVSSDLINVANFSFTKTDAQAIDPPVFSALDTNYPGQTDSVVVVTGIERLAAGNVEPVKQIQDKFDWSDNIYWTRGAHDMRTGFSVQRVRSYQAGAGNAQGNWGYQSLASFMTNTPLNFVGPLPGPTTDNTARYYRRTNFAMYFQDNWKVSQRLTLNLGLRYEPNTIPVGWASEGVPITTVIYPLATATGFSPVTALSATNTSLKTFEPRIGLSYMPFGQKTVIRAGFGIYYDELRMFLYNGFYGQNPPYLTETVSNNPVGTLVFPNAFTGTAKAPKPSNGGGGIGYYNNKPPRDVQYNLNIQRALSSGLIMTVAYVGGHGVHQLAIQDQNPVVMEIVNGAYTFPTSANRLNNNFGYLTEQTDAATSNYNALQATLTGKIAKSLQMQLYYTFAKNMSDADNSILGESINGSMGGVNPYDVHYDYGPSSYDIRHNLTGNLLYQLPFQQNRWLGGFQFSTILSVHSNSPYSVDAGYDVSNQGNTQEQERLNVVANGNLAGTVAANPACSAPASVHNAAHWFNPCAFTPPATGTLGDEQRNSLYGPDYADFDMGLTRTIRITEALRAELRAEAFNIFNRTNFHLPSSLNDFSLVQRDSGSGAHCGNDYGN